MIVDTEWECVISQGATFFRSNSERFAGDHPPDHVDDGDAELLLDQRVLLPLLLAGGQQMVHQTVRLLLVELKQISNFINNYEQEFTWTDSSDFRPNPSSLRFRKINLNQKTKKVSKLYPILAKKIAFTSSVPSRPLCCQGRWFPKVCPKISSPGPSWTYLWSTFVFDINSIVCHFFASRTFSYFIKCMMELKVPSPPRSLISPQEISEHWESLTTITPWTTLTIRVA